MKKDKKGTEGGEDEELKVGGWSEREWRMALEEVVACSREMKSVVDFMLDKMSGREADMRVLLGLCGEWVVGG